MSGNADWDFKKDTINLEENIQSVVEGIDL